VTCLNEWHLSSTLGIDYKQNKTYIGDVY